MTNRSLVFQIDELLGNPHVGFMIIFLGNGRLTENDIMPCFDNQLGAIVYFLLG
jgi:hypothetical protein